MIGERGPKTGKVLQVALSLRLAYGQDSQEQKYTGRLIETERCKQGVF